MTKTLDIFIIGGGINGTGVARDAAGRGLSVTLAEMGDLGGATSSASTKLFHGGLRYLEFFEFRLVREALIERENLLAAVPHISWPMRFVLPVHKSMRFEGSTPASKLLTLLMPWMKGRRPAWMIRLGLFIYDNLGGRKILPATTRLDLRHDPAGAPLREKFTTAFEYSDCWVQDARLVVLNARDARARGATILPRTIVTNAKHTGDHWEIETRDQNSGEVALHRAAILVNAGGPWVQDIIENTVETTAQGKVRLVRGSHIVTRKLFEGDKTYFFQGKDGRICFAIPYEDDFTLIGTTDADHDAASTVPECTTSEQEYLCEFVSQYLVDPINTDDIVWHYAGVRPLYDDGAANATAATREYVIKVNQEAGGPLINIFGGKITTYRKLAESVLDEVVKLRPNTSENWTCRVPLPGGDFPVDGVDALLRDFMNRFAFIERRYARRLLRSYGTDCADLLAGCKSLSELGRHFGGDVYQRELDWAIDNEWVQTGEDFLWRRTKRGLYLDTKQRDAVDEYIQARRAKTA
ncbi:glycerol-3-phosphate dehydrogenase [Amylibacter marinus]|uniref:Glycerol-3-phosphate dehydrogenase n=1 Tax=Amylibacter marinus TaxID=1475483 RepID=A0ABQ5VYM9_9RHOB|nr:glycerol-3-phosphate dehydrogenase [Amylibacter marinus]GLQ36302.1 glycerol-3-phosphate dehydrogenase [Amylibacter marinus]